MIKLVINDVTKTFAGEHSFSFKTLSVKDFADEFISLLFIDGKEVMRSGMFDTHKQAWDTSSQLVEDITDLLLLSETEAGQWAIFKAEIDHNFSLNVTCTCNKSLMERLGLMG